MLRIYFMSDEKDKPQQPAQPQAERPINEGANVENIRNFERVDTSVPIIKSEQGGALRSTSSSEED